jgi:hypothetical protein
LQEKSEEESLVIVTLTRHGSNLETRLKKTAEENVLRFVHNRKRRSDYHAGNS